MRVRVLTSLLLLLLVLLYPLSYPPYLAVRYGDAFERETPGDYKHALYRPVEYLIDATPLRKPLMRWGEAWGVDEEMALLAAGRMQDATLQSLLAHDSLRTKLMRMLGLWPDPSSAFA